MSKKGARPLKAQIGWVDTDVRKDAIELAKGSAHKYLDAPEISYYAVMPLLGGHLWEIQEAGAGLSYLPSVAEALAKNVEPAWFRFGSKAHTFALRDGRPYCTILSNADSKKLIESDFPELRPKGRMEVVVRKGRKVFAVGMTVFATGFLFLLANVGAYVGLEHMMPEARIVDVETLPHRQWTRVERTPKTLFVDSLKLNGTQWATSTKPIIRVASDAPPASSDGGARVISPVSPAGVGASSMSTLPKPMVPGPMPPPPAPIPSSQVAVPPVVSVGPPPPQVQPPNGAAGPRAPGSPEVPNPAQFHVPPPSPSVPPQSAGPTPAAPSVPTPPVPRPVAPSATHSPPSAPATVPSPVPTPPGAAQPSHIAPTGMSPSVPTPTEPRPPSSPPASPVPSKPVTMVPGVTGAPMPVVTPPGAPVPVVPAHGLTVPGTVGAPHPQMPSPQGPIVPPAKPAPVPGLPGAAAPAAAKPNG